MSRRRHAPDQGPAKFHITVMSADGTEQLWHGATLDREELTALAEAARRLRPEARILIRHPMFGLYSWE
jgi:hypothetical protein